MRVFAGPNGSGKSSVIKYVRAQKANNYPIDFGIYINADDIANSLREDSFSFKYYQVKTTDDEFLEMAMESGLINDSFNKKQLKNCYDFVENAIRLNVKSAKHAGIDNPDERLAQLIADFLRKKLLAEKKRFSFEMVFSHKGKLDIMQEAIDAGYKVYLYFVSTNDPAINIGRVKARKEKGGHDVPVDKIESRYYRSMDLLYEASQLAYQAFYFDNSVDGEQTNLFAHFKKSGSDKVWDDYTPDQLPDWFIKYYYKKQPK